MSILGNPVLPGGGGGGGGSGIGFFSSDADFCQYPDAPNVTPIEVKKRFGAGMKALLIVLHREAVTLSNSEIWTLEFTAQHVNSSDGIIQYLSIYSSISPDTGTVSISTSSGSRKAACVVYVLPNATIDFSNPTVITPTNTNAYTVPASDSFRLCVMSQIWCGSYTYSLQPVPFGAVPSSVSAGEKINCRLAAFLLLPSASPFYMTNDAGTGQNFPSNRLFCFTLS